MASCLMLVIEVNACALLYRVANPNNFVFIVFYLKSERFLVFDSQWFLKKLNYKYDALIFRFSTGPSFFAFFLQIKYEARESIKG